MSFFDCILITFATLYTFLHAALFVGILLERRREKAQSDSAAFTPETLVSVIVPMRNEEAALPLLLKALEAQTHTAIEYIFIDDESTDGTSQLLSEWGANRSNVTIITLPIKGGARHEEGGAKVINRKQAALSIGIAQSNGKALLFTDADCEPDPLWASYMARAVLQEGVGVVLGPVYKSAGGAQGLLRGYQAFDQLVRGMYIAGAVGLGAAGGGFGNNIALRREALEQSGGYEKVAPSLTEDAALIALIRKRTPYKIRAVYERAAHIRTRSEPTWASLVQQTLRWHLGGLCSRDVVTALSFIFVVALYIACFLAWFLAIINPIMLLIPLLAWIEIVLGNLPVRLWSGKSCPLSFPRYLCFAFFMGYYFTFLSFLAFLGIKPRWK